MIIIGRGTAGQGKGGAFARGARQAAAEVGYSIRRESDAIEAGTGSQTGVTRNDVDHVFGGLFGGVDGASPSVDDAAARHAQTVKELNDWIDEHPEFAKRC